MATDRIEEWTQYRCQCLNCGHVWTERVEGIQLDDYPMDAQCPVCDKESYAITGGPYHGRTLHQGGLHIEIG